MKDRELMEQALEALTGGLDVPKTIQALRERIHVLKEQEDWYSMPKESRDKIRMAQMGNRKFWKPELDPKYEEAKRLRESGMMLKDACEKTGLTRDQWYRRQRIELRGKDWMQK